MNKTLRLLFIFVISNLIIVNANAKSKKTHDSICGPRVPEIEYDKAIVIAIKTFATYQIIDSAFIDYISLECKEKKYFWIVGFRRRAYESGHLLIYVYMDGATKTLVVKDG